MNKEVVEKALASAGITADVIQVGDGDFVIDGAKQAQIMGHGGFAGQSIIEKIRDDLDETYAEYRNLEIRSHHERDRYYGMAEGIAHALGVLRSSSADHEWEEAEQRYDDAKIRFESSKDSMTQTLPHPQQVVAGEADTP